ncbi:hypothetical protein LTR92_000649 [Exophiala xenobiotica]|nr:hypothetical protein LTR92_000649 [Exophiala xenobiotica]
MRMYIVLKEKEPEKRMNRKQRRVKGSGSPAIASAEDIPLSRPDTTRPKTQTKTLFEIAAERQAELTGQSSEGRAGAISQPTPIKPENIVQVKIGDDGKIIQPDDPSFAFSSELPVANTPNETPWLDALLLAASLSAIHFTLEVLTVHQYAQDLEFSPIFWRTLLVAFPTLTVIVSLFRGLLLPDSIMTTNTISPRVRLGVLTLRQIVYVLVANVAGCYLIALTNDKGYYAVMKDAPSIGTIWVWAVLELGLLGALAGVIGPGIYAWWNGYGIF